MADEAAPATTTTVTSSDEKNLVVSFIQFIRHKVSANQCTEDQIEALEVAVQCMESAFGLTDANYAFQPSKPLLDVFIAAEGLPSGEDKLPEPTEAEIAEANKLKEEGNDLMKASQFDAAVSKYNEAIKLNRDPVYFCNRAAAYCRLEQYDLAIQDCRTALALDPKYSKAYGRMGQNCHFSLALSCQNRYEQAVEAYKKALELDPNQESFKNNLKIAEEKVKELEAAAQASGAQPNPFAAMFGGAGGAGGASLPPGVDFASLFNNPQMLNMAQTLMNDPNIQNMMGQLMSGGAGFGNIFQAGQQLAQQMQQTNPEFVEQLRRQFEGHGPNDGENEGGENNQPGQQQ
ncbi:tetratricopeptide repeat protein [Ostertagia ostertagi]